MSSLIPSFSPEAQLQPYLPGTVHWLKKLGNDNLDKDRMVMVKRRGLDWRPRHEGEEDHPIVLLGTKHGDSSRQLAAIVSNLILGLYNALISKRR